MAPGEATSAGAVSGVTGRAWLGRGAAWFLGLTFVVSAGAKMLSINSFEVYVVQQGLLPSRELAAVAARVLLAAELFLGLACLTRSWFRRLTLPAVGAMLAGFSVYLAYLAFVKGDQGSCHCFGELLEMSPLHSLYKNLVLLAVVLYLGRWGSRGWGAGSWRVPACLAAASAVAVGLGFPIRHIEVQPVPGVEPPRESPFAQFREFDTGPGDLTEGVCLAAFVSLDCEHCQALVTQLGEMARQQELPPLYLICYGAAEEVPVFLTTTGADFPSLCVTPEVFFEYIGKEPPRLYLLEGGQARAYWDVDTFDPAQLAPWWPPG